MTATLQSLWPGHDMRPPPLSLRDCIARVSEQTGVTVADLKGVSQVRKLAWPRQAFYALAAEQTWADGRQRYSLTQIARFCGDRDHTTVLHGIRAHAARVKAAQRAGEGAP